MRSNEWPGLRGLLSLFMALMLVLGTASGVLAQATPDASPTGEAVPALGDAVILFDSSGDELLQVAVTDLVDPDDGAGDADRGFHWVGIEVVASNPTDADVDFNAFAIQLVDEQGFVASMGFSFRDEEDVTARPDFNESTVPAGGAISGWLFYQVINEATIEWVVFNDGFGAQQFAVLANLAGHTVEDGDEIPFFEASGDEAGTVVVDEVITGFEDVDSEVSPPRGATVVGVNITISNSSSGEVSPSTSSFTLIDDFGYLYYPAFYFRGEESLTQYPEFTGSPIPAGGSESGLVLFEIPSDAEISYILFQPDFSQLYITAQPGEGSTVSGETLTPVPGTDDTGDDTGDSPGDDTGDDTDDDTGDTGGVETGDCVGVSDWAVETSENLEIINVFEEVESLSDVEPDELRDVADQMRDVADEQADLEVPAVAQDTNDAVVAMLETFADLFEDAADRLDAGDDPAEIEADVGENEEFAAVFTDFFTTYSNLSIACPDSDLGDF